MKEQKSDIWAKCAVLYVTALFLVMLGAMNVECIIVPSDE